MPINLEMPIQVDCEAPTDTRQISDTARLAPPAPIIDLLSRSWRSGNPLRGDTAARVVRRTRGSDGSITSEMPRQALDARENLTKGGPSQVTSGQV